MAEEFEKYQNGGPEQAKELIEKVKTLYGIDLVDQNNQIKFVLS